MSNWIESKVIKYKEWNDSLFSISILPLNPGQNLLFEAGQYGKLGINIKKDESTRKRLRPLARAYSFVNPPSSKYFEFCIVKVAQYTNKRDLYLSHLLHALRQGDHLLLYDKAYGNMTLSNVPDNHDKLWLIATGTGIAPYLSILQDMFNSQVPQRFKRIILVHAVRYIKDLSYLSTLKELEKKSNGILKVQHIVSREKCNGNILQERIPALISNKKLQKTVDLDFDKNDSHVMLCGNPDMVRETTYVLETCYNLKKSKSNDLGNITTERYW